MTCSQLITMTNPLTNDSYQHNGPVRSQIEMSSKQGFTIGKHNKVVGEHSGTSLNGIAS